MRSVLTRRKQDSQPEEKVKTEAGIGGCTLKMKEGAISQRMQAGLMLEEARQRILPWSLQKEPAQLTLTLAQ